MQLVCVRVCVRVCVFLLEINMFERYCLPIQAARTIRYPWCLRTESMPAKRQGQASSGQMDR